MEIYFTGQYIRNIKKLPRDAQKSVHSAVKILHNWPQVSNIKAMVNQPGYRLRVGRYRVMFEIEGEKIVVTDVKIRNERTY